MEHIVPKEHIKKRVTFQRNHFKNRGFPKLEFQYNVVYVGTSNLAGNAATVNKAVSQGFAKDAAGEHHATCQVLRVLGGENERWSRRDCPVMCVAG
jgi:hypothetical protein